MRISALILAMLLTGCADEPGACIESVRHNSVSTGWCLEVTTPSQCPTAESVNEEDAYRFQFISKGSCFDEGYEFACAGEVFEDIESECAQWDFLDE